MVIGHGTRQTPVTVDHCYLSLGSEFEFIFLIHLLKLPPNIFFDDFSMANIEYLILVSFPYPNMIIRLTCCHGQIFF